MARGLGKGLNSLIPEIYDEDFDSNSAQSLEDILNEQSSEESTVEEKNEEILDENSEEKISEDSDDLEEISEDIVDEEESDVEDVVDDDRQEDEEEHKSEETTNEEIQEESPLDIRESEDVSGDESDKDSLPNPQEIKRQENVAEVLDIVDKNPRITLWSSRSAAVFRYLRKTEPEFSISREASILIDEAVSKKYPDIWDLFEDLK